ncbi:hypothetical protein WG78_14590 [Amantichitinum ursilacus]|uniref:Uncharacterized protein n=1 Tax=Amantichitinum ursilacus TaxID=857265 RepID=A0A0N0XKI7_9NEIS|nr:hypothetical protein WG78_14590 [Amantichitinum ursilacus]
MFFVNFGNHRLLEASTFLLASLFASKDVYAEPVPIAFARDVVVMGYIETATFGEYDSLLTGWHQAGLVSFARNRVSFADCRKASGVLEEFDDLNSQWKTVSLWSATGLTVADGVAIRICLLGELARAKATSANKEPPSVNDYKRFLEEAGLPPY